MSDKETYVYVAFNENGDARAFVRDELTFAEDTAERVSGWIKEGRTVQRMTWADGMAAMKKSPK